VLFFGLTLLTVSLLRRRRALEWEVERRAIAEKQLTRLNATLEQRVAERTADLQQLVGGLESFNRSVSHDLRGPLGGIEGLAQLALDGLAQGDATVAQRALPAIAAQAQTSHRLVDALLQLARVSDATLRRASVDLAALVQEVVGELSQTRPGDGLPAIEVGALPAARGDADLLRPVLRNLIGNAIKFSRETPDAKVTIHGSTTTEEVVVSVRDNGVGFEPQAASRLFQPFRRLHEGRFEGSGVGLSIVRRAVERHGGRVWAESEPGQGAAFYFSLPR
jgi:signal transduction histidine kinase